MLERIEDLQIKSECKIADLAKGVDFITKNFDEYEKDQREKNTIIATLQSELKSVKSWRSWEEDGQAKTALPDNYFLIHGLREEKNKRTDDRVLELFRKELNETVLLVDLDRTHRIRQKRVSNCKPHLVFCKICAI